MALMPEGLAQRLCNLERGTWETLLAYLTLRELQLNSQFSVLRPTDTEAYIAMNTMLVNGGLNELRLIRDLPRIATEICKQESLEREALERKRG